MQMRNSSVSLCVSWVHHGAEAEVKAKRFHDPVGGAFSVHVSGGKHTGVLLNDRCCSNVGHLIEIALHCCPGILTILLKVRSRIDSAHCRFNVGNDICYILLVYSDVFAIAEPSHVTTNEVLPVIRQGDLRSFDGAGDVFVEVEDVKGRPTREDEVNEHERVVIRQVNIYVVGRMIGAVPCQLDALAANVQCPLVLENLLRGGSRSIVVTQQEMPCLFVSDASYIFVEQR